MNKISKQTLSIAGIGLGILVLGMVWSIVNTALASIQKDLSANVLQLQWMMNCFGICICVPLLTMGKLGDAYGRKRLYICGLLCALVASIVAGFARDIHLLIACMGLFGLSGSITLPLSQALLVHQYPENEKGKAVGLWSLFASLSLAAGPLVGGIILSFCKWRWIYWINIPLILLVLPIIIFFVKKDDSHQHKLRCDWKGVALLALMICSLIIAIMQGPSWGWTSFPIVGLFVIAVITLLVFVTLEKKSSAPLFRSDLFSQRPFLFSSIPNACMIGFIWIVFFLIPLYLQNMMGYVPIEVGIFLLLVTLPVAFLSVLVSKLYRKWEAKPLLVIGFSLFIIASLLQVFFVSQSPFLSIGIGCLLIGMGWVLVWGPSTTHAISSLPHHAAGIASGMFTTLQEFGAIVTLAITGVIFRLMQQRILSPQMNQIQSSLQDFSSDQVQSLLTNPLAVERHLGESSPILVVLKKGFLAGYIGSFWFLILTSAIAIFLSLLLPKRSASVKKRISD